MNFALFFWGMLKYIRTQRWSMRWRGADAFRFACPPLLSFKYTLPPPLHLGETTGQEKPGHQQGPLGKIWDEVHERDTILIRGKQLVIPKSLQAQAIAIAHEGHQQTDGTLRML